MNATASNALPEDLRRVAAETTIQQQPSFGKNMIGRDVVGDALQDGFGKSIAAVALCRRCEPN